MTRTKRIYGQKAKCRICGCTNHKPCFCASGNHCYWVNPYQDLCSECAGAASIVVDAVTDLAVGTVHDNSASTAESCHASNGVNPRESGSNPERSNLEACRRTGGSDADSRNSFEKEQSLPEANFDPART